MIDMNTGMKIKIFPDTDVEAYVRYIKEKGFNSTVYKDFILVEGSLKTEYIDKTALGNALIVARANRGISREEMSQAIGVSENAIFSWEIGRTIPRADNLKRFCEYAGINQKKLIEKVTVRRENDVKR